MMGVIILPTFLPKTLNFTHLHIRVNASFCPACVELPDLLLQAICLNEALIFLYAFCVSQVLIMLSLHKKIL